MLSAASGRRLSPRTGREDERDEKRRRRDASRRVDGTVASSAAVECGSTGSRHRFRIAPASRSPSALHLLLLLSPSSLFVLSKRGQIWRKKAGRERTSARLKSQTRRVISFASHRFIVSDAADEKAPGTCTFSLARISPASPSFDSTCFHSPFLRFFFFRHNGKTETPRLIFVRRHVSLFSDISGILLFLFIKS